MGRYPAFLAEFLGSPRNHYAIYVDVNQGLSGYLLHVVGTLQKGMELKVSEDFRNPTFSLTFLGMRQVGWVPHSKLGHCKNVCETVPPPAKQWDRGRPLLPLDQLRRCQEWTAEAVDVLRESGVLQQLRPTEDPIVIIRDKTENGTSHG
ncbi:hypothetical protein B0T25DRAFT_457106 [Lasiosphaeria hispida]|uniref:Uncharacterized protein n=1 Tax=Lasiosphaeria hispida TaxID=260671 RepID=A0AAJ0HG83_9PEZI|nr:hypothetical protein B0T25DRAFT_457106 [Lasiosphaeria hispida]